MDKIKNITKFVLKQVKATAIDGEELEVSPETQAIRKSFCLPCKSNIDGECKECHCIIDEKVRYTESECDLGKWNQTEL